MRYGTSKYQLKHFSIKPHLLVLESEFVEFMLYDRIGFTLAYILQAHKADFISYTLSHN